MTLTLHNNWVTLHHHRQLSRISLIQFNLQFPVRSGTENKKNVWLKFKRRIYLKRWHWHWFLWRVSKKINSSRLILNRKDFFSVLDRTKSCKPNRMKFMLQYRKKKPITPKPKIGKILDMLLLSFQHIPHILIWEKSVHFFFANCYLVH